MIPEWELGEHYFNVTMTLEEAREQAKRLNNELETIEITKGYKASS